MQIKFEENRAANTATITLTLNGKYCTLNRRIYTGEWYVVGGSEVISFSDFAQWLPILSGNPLYWKECV